jgi:hypothetical protein
MKYLIILLTILVIIWSLNAYVCSFINNSAQIMLEHVKSAKAAAQAKDITAASQEISQLREIWESDEGRWEAFTDHREVEQVDTSINHLEGMVDEGSTDDMPVELQELEFILRKMNEKHMFRVENIF